MARASTSRADIDAGASALAHPPRGALVCDCLYVFAYVCLRNMGPCLGMWERTWGLCR
jgi:hypothetical protein